MGGEKERPRSGVDVLGLLPHSLSLSSVLPIELMLAAASAVRRAPAYVRHSSGLPFRIRAPLAKLQERKSRAQDGQVQGHRPPALGDGEKLESSGAGPDYVRLALTSRVYDMVQESPLQYASGLRSRLQANLHGVDVEKRGTGRDRP